MVHAARMTSCGRFRPQFPCEVDPAPRGGAAFAGQPLADWQSRVAEGGAALGVAFGIGKTASYAQL